MFFFSEYNVDRILMFTNPQIGHKAESSACAEAQVLTPEWEVSSSDQTVLSKTSLVLNAWLLTGILGPV